MKKIIENKRKRSILSVICIFFLLVTLLIGLDFGNNKGNISFGNVALNGPVIKDYVYLSDLDYLTTSGMSQNGWSGHSIQKDKNQEGGELSLIVNGEKRPYVKGVSIHARGWATYDISTITSDYPRFIAKIGVDGGRGTAGSIKYTIFGTNDLTNWDTLLTTPVMTGIDEAVDVDLNVEGYKYLRIYVDPNGNNTSDHGTIANAKFVKEDYVEQETSYEKIHKIEYYDEILSRYDAEYNLEHNYRLILEREFVHKIGYWTIQNKVEYSPEYIDTIDWLLASDERLEQLIEVGEVRNGTVFLDTIHTIYSAYKDELKTENGYVYQKMLIGLAAAYKTDNVASPLTFSTSPREYDVLERYRLMKLLFDTGKFQRPEEFKTYHVELMRFVMQDAISNGELIWLNEYSRTKADPFNKYSYISYRYNPAYNQPAYQDPANKEKYDTKYLLSKYNVPYGDGVIRYWMAFEYGGICWNISRIGQTINKIKGIPSVGIYQPDHEAYIIYSQRADGTGLWTQNYNIFGWGKSSTKWWGGNRYRLLLNWSDKYFSNQVMSSSNYGTSSGYLLLGQAALNRREEWTKSLYLNYLANSYTNDEDKLEIYNKALESLNINLDSYDYIINLYKRTNRSSAEWHDLADKIIAAYTYYPNAMYDILKIIKPYLEGMDRIDIDLKEQEALKAGTKATDADVLQSGPTREIANTLLGRARQELASFSFDGDNAGKIIINSAYEDYDFNLSYSIDGGNTFSEKTTSHAIQLTPEEIARITAENDIIIAMDGTRQRYRIDISKGVIATNLYGNDLENRVIGINTTYEWRNNDNELWTSYAVASPNNTGDKTLHVRVGAHGVNLPSDELTFTFTADNQPDTRKYVPVSHYSIHAYSTQSKDTARPYYAPNAIDGNGNTFWHTDYGQNVLQQSVKPFITIKLDKLRFISAVEFKQVLDPKRPSDPDSIKNARIYVSEDGENWTLGGQIENCPQDKELRVVDFAESLYGQYVKIEMDTYNMFASLALVNIFQDLTQNPRPTGGIGYSTTEPTKENVIARLINVSAENYRITNNGGSDTYVFTEEGDHSFTFEFIDTDTNKTGTATARVNWIDRTAPTATIKYNITNPTNKTVYSTLVPNEEVTVTNNTKFSLDEDDNVLDGDGNILENYTTDENGNVKNPEGLVVGNISTLIHEFYTNGEFVYEFVDRAGNKGTATAKVTWIDEEAPIPTLTYDKETLTNEDVTVTIDFNEEATVINNKGSKTYTFSKNGEFTFEFRDDAGNIGSITAKVNWIDKEAPQAKLKYERQGNKVIVRVEDASEEIEYVDGIGVYEFTKNGKYPIVIRDKAGNETTLMAEITGLSSGSTGEPTNPDKPDEPDKPDDNKPGDDNNKPGDSDKPNENPGNNGGDTNNKPDNNGSSNNGNNSNNNQGSNNGNNNNSNGNNSGNNNGSGNGGSTTTPINKDYKKYNFKNVEVEIPSSLVQEGMDLVIKEFKVAKELEVMFGDASEYYDVAFAMPTGEIELNSDSPLRVSIKLKSNKEFIGVYEITDQNTIKPIDYVKNGQTVEITTKSLGRYVISYKGIKAINPSVTLPVINEDNKRVRIFPWVIGAMAVISLGVFIYMVKNDKD